MNRRNRFFLSILLVFCMLAQPFVPVFAAPATSSSDAGTDAADAMEQFNEVYEQVMALEEVELGGVTSFCVGATSGITNVGKWFANGWDKLTNGGQNQQEYVDYIGQIEDANKDIRDAKAQMEEIKATFDAGNVQDAIDADPAKVAANGIAAQANAMSTLQTTLKTAGTALQEVGKLLDTLSTVTSVISLVLKGIAIAFPPSAAVIAAVTPVLDVASTAMGVAGPLIEAAGDSLVETSEAATISDDVLLRNMAVDVGVEGGKQIATHLLSKGTEKVIGDFATYLDPDDVEGMTGTITSFWDPKSAASAGVSKYLQGQYGADLVTEEVEEFFDEFAETGMDLAVDATGAKFGSPAEMLDDAVEAGFDSLGETLKGNDTQKKSTQPAGLSVD